MVNYLWLCRSSGVNSISEFLDLHPLFPSIICFFLIPEREGGKKFLGEKIGVLGNVISGMVSFPGSVPYGSIKPMLLVCESLQMTRGHAAALASKAESLCPFLHCVWWDVAMLCSPFPCI